MNEVKGIPVTPEEMDAVRGKYDPRVIEAFNELIREKWSVVLKRADFEMIDIVNRIADALQLSRDEVVRNGYLEHDTAFKEIGWVVKTTASLYRFELKK